MTGVVLPVVERLESLRGAIGLMSVEDVFGLAAAVDGLKVSPSAFVVRTGGSARPSSANTLYVIQDTEVRFDVLIGTTLEALPGAVDELDAVCAGVLTALLGWAHPLADAPVEFRGDGLAQLNLTGGLHFWRQSYGFERTIRSI